MDAGVRLEIDEAVVRAVSPEPARHGDAFTAWRIGASLLGRDADPFLNVDHFRMSGPTFPPHAHAGFSAVTYLLPESAAGMRNRDGRGDRSLIRPGGVHWTAAGAGLIHEEVPEPDGTVAHGMQIFVRQPVVQESASAVVHRVEPEDVPVVSFGTGSTLLVVAGSFAAHTAPFTPPSPLQILDLTLAPGDGLEWRSPFSEGGAALYLFDGGLDVNGAQFAAPIVIVTRRGAGALRLAATIGDARLLILAGAPLDAPSVSNGPFVLSSQQALSDAVERYRAGGMGRIDG